MASIYGAARRTFVPPYKARRRQRERAAFVQSIHGGDIQAASLRDEGQCQCRGGVSQSCGLGAVVAASAQRGEA